MKNTGKPSQQQFEDLLHAKYGKLVFIHRITDAAEVRGMNNNKFARVKKQPSDYLLTINGEMQYAEVKSTHGTRISRSCLESGQYAACKQQLAAKGRYDVFVHALRTGRWYRLPGTLFINSPPTTKSWSFDDLARYEFS